MDVNLNIKTDLNPVLQGFANLKTGMNDLQDSTSELGKNSDKVYKNIKLGIAGVSDSINDASGHTKELGDHVDTVGHAAKTIRALRQELNVYVSNAEKAGEGTAAWTANLEKAAHTKEKIKELQAVLGGIAGNEAKALTQAFTTVTQTGIQGFEGIVAAEGLFGTKSEEVEKQLLKLQSLQALSNIIGEFSELGEKVTQFKIAFAPISGLYTKANDAIKNFSISGKLSFSSLASGAKSLFSSIGSGIVSFVKSGINGLKALGAAAAANPFGLILIAIVAIIGILVALKDKVKPIAAIFDFLKGIIDDIIVGFEKLGEAIGIVADAADKRAEETVKNSKKELEALKNRYEFELAYAEALGRDTKDIEKRKFNAVSDRIKETLQALTLLKLSNGKLDDEQLKEFEEAQNEYADLVKESLLARAKEEKKAEDEKKEREKKALEEAKKNAEKLKALQKDLSDALLDLAKRAAQADISQLTGKDKVEAQKKFGLQEIEVLRDTIIKKGQLEEDFDAKIHGRRANTYKLTLDQEKQFESLRRALINDAAAQEIQLEIDKQNKLAAAKAGISQQKVGNIDVQQKNDISAVELSAKPKDVSEIDFELLKQKKILEIQRDYATKQLVLRQEALENEKNVALAGLNGELKLLEGKNDAESNLKRKQIQESEGLILEKFDLENTAIQDETALQLNEISKKIDDTIKALAKHDKFNLAALLGISDEKLKEITTGLKEFSDQFVQALNAIFDSELAQNQQEIDLSKQKQDQLGTEISDLQSQLDKEKQLRDQGLANNTDRLQKDIDAKVKAQALEKEKEKEALEERKKIQKEKLLLDSILQLSNIATAATEIFKVVAKDPITTAIAIATVAAMITAFTVTKIQALKAINQGSGYKDGIVDIQGPGTETSDSINARLSKGESVMNARITKGHKPLLSALHSENDGLIQKALIDELKGTGVIIDGRLSQKLIDRKDAIRDTEARIYFKQDSSRIEKHLEGVNDKLEFLLEQNKNKQYKDQNDNLVIHQGTHKTIIKKRG